MKMLLSNLRSAVCAFSSILVLAVIGAAQSGRVVPTPTPKEDDTVRVFTEEIKLNVLAFDDDGKFSPDVKERDLVITENNILHQPSSVRRIPAHVMIVMDTGGEMRFIKSLDQTRKTARAVVDALRPEDSVALLQYSDKAEIVEEWTNDRSQTLKAIGKTTFGRRSAFVEALRLAMDFLSKNPVENKHLILITDGTDSFVNVFAKETELKRLLATDITVHVISYTSMEYADLAPRTKGTSTTRPRNALPDEVIAQLPNGSRQANQSTKVGPTINLDRTMLEKLKARKKELETSERSLAAVADNTNGEFILPTSLDEMVEKTALVARMIDSSYVVTYTPKMPIYEGKGLVERTIDVTSRRPGLVVQSRRKLVFNTGKNK